MVLYSEPATIFFLIKVLPRLKAVAIESRSYKLYYKKQLRKKRKQMHKA